MNSPTWSLRLSYTVNEQIFVNGNLTEILEDLKKRAENLKLSDFKYSVDMVIEQPKEVQ